MIQTKITKDIYHGDGTTRRFEVTFDYNTKNNVKQIDLYTCTYTTEEGVTKYNNDVTKITSNYDFEIVDNVTYAVYPSDAAVSDGATPIATGTAIIIMRNTPNEQLSTGQYTSEKVEKQLDRITMVAQELQEQIDRCPKAPKYAESISEADFTTVAQNIDSVNNVSNNISSVNTVATNIEDVKEVNDNIEDVKDAAEAVSALEPYLVDISTVADNTTAVNTVSSDIQAVNTVSSNISDVGTVASNSTNIDTVSNNISNINTAATNMSSIIAAPTAAQNASTYATNAYNSATDASNSAIQAAAAVTSCETITNNAVASINRPLLSFIWSDHLINNIAWLRGDTFSWQSGDVYTAVYNHLTNDLYKDFLFDFRNDSDYYIYGSPTIQDGIVSGIKDKQNTVGTASAISLTDNDSLEIKLKLLNTGNSACGLFDTISSIDSKCTLGTSSGISWKANYAESTSTTVNIPLSTFDWRNRDVLYIKLNCSHKDSNNNTTYSISVSTDNISWITASSVANYRIQNKALRFGSSGNDLSYGTTVNYSIDLNESYVKKNTAQTETIGSYTITYYQANDGHKVILADQETTSQNIFNESGVAWYYILDTANVRFKLPRSKYAFVGLRDNVGKYVAESLPNIKGRLYNHPDQFGAPTASDYEGALYPSSGTSGGTASNMSDRLGTINFDASLSSSTYQDNAPVQQRATQMYLYFYIGNFSQSATEQTAGLNAELFNDKVDKSDMTEVQCVVETYSNGTEWYRIWSDGWCEQGGQATLGTFSYTFLKPYLNSPFVYFQCNSTNTATATNQGAWMINSIPTTTGFTVMNAFTSSVHLAGYWRAEGYIS